MNNSLKRHSIVLLLLMLCVVIGYWGTLDYPFMFDDKVNIVESQAIKIQGLDRESLQQVIDHGVASRRPVANISFALNYYFHGDNVAGWHCVNIAIHIFAGWLVYGVIFQTLRINARLREDDSDPGASSKAAMLTALAVAAIWIVHPIQTQAVTYIVQRMTSLATMFYLLGLFLYIIGRTRKDWSTGFVCYVVAVVAFVLAVLSKEIAITLPLMIALYEWYFFQNLRRDWAKLGLISLGIAGAVMMIIVFGFMGSDPLRSISGGFAIRDFTMWERVMTEWRVVLFYLSLLALPLPQWQNLDHDVEISRALTDPITTVVALVIVVASLVAAGWMARRHRLLSFCILWYFITLALESTIVNLELVFEHRLYLPSVFVVAGIVYAARRHLKVPTVARCAATAVIVALLCFATINRNSVWSSKLSMWEDCVAKSPNKPRSHNNMGRYLAAEGEVEKGMIHLARALEIDKDYKAAHSNIGILYRQQNNYAKAIEHYLEAIRIDPKFVSAHYNLGISYRKTMRLENAIKHYLIAYDLDPYNVQILNNLAIALDMNGETKRAIEFIDKALRVNSKFEMAVKNKTRFENKLKLPPPTPPRPKQPTATTIFQRAMKEQLAGRHQAAVEGFRNAQALGFENQAELNNNLGMSLLALKAFRKAEAAFRNAIGFDSQFDQAHNNLGASLGQQGRLEEALPCFVEALRLNPDYEDAQKNVERVNAYLDKQKREP
jgi:tetratricopeptide (TPR) repeat protein